MITSSVLFYLAFISISFDNKIKPIEQIVFPNPIVSANMPPCVSLYNTISLENYPENSL